MEYCQNENKIFTFISLDSNNWESRIQKTNFSHFIYLSSLHVLSSDETSELFRLIKNRKCIVSTTKDIKTHYTVVKLDSEVELYDGSYIMSIEEYIQFIIRNFNIK